MIRWEQHLDAGAASPVGPWEFGWDALGVIVGGLAALATVGAVIAALATAKKDREAAEAAITRQLEAAEAARLREHRLELVFRLMQAVGEYRGAVQKDPVAARTGRGKARGFLAALGEEADAMPWCQHLFLDGPNPEEEVFPVQHQARAEHAVDEVAALMERLGRENA